MTRRRARINPASASVAVVLAVLVWLVATSNARPMESRAFPLDASEDLPITFQGLDSVLAAYEPSATSARLELRGVRDALDAIQPGELVVEARLNGVDKPGTVTVPLHARCAGCGRSAFRIARVMPASVTVKVDARVVVTRPVRVLVDGTSQTACRRMVTDVRPPLAVVSGARPRMDSVEVVAARLDALGADQGEAQFPNQPVTALDSQGAPLAAVTIEPPVVNVTVGMETIASCIEAVVLANYNRPPEGYLVSDTSVVPSVVELSGPPGRLDSLRGTVYTEPVDLGEAEGTVERRVRLDLPDGVTAVGAPEGVTVTIRVAPLPGTRTFDVELSPDGLSSTLEVASITPARVQVLLSGPLPILDAMKASDIRALLPLDGVVEGTHRLPPTYDVPPGVRVRTSTPAEVEVVLRPRAGPPGG